MNFTVFSGRDKSKIDLISVPRKEGPGVEISSDFIPENRDILQIEFIWIKSMVNLAAVFSKRFKEGFKFKKVLNEPDFEDVHRGQISKSFSRTPS